MEIKSKEIDSTLTISRLLQFWSHPHSYCVE